MVDLSRLRRARASRDDRAQLLLVGAFGIAVFLLAFAGVLNTITYTESLAGSDGTGPSSRDLAAFQEDVRSGVGGALVRINAGTGTYSEKDTRLDRSVGNWSQGVGRQYLLDSASLDVSLVAADEGSRIAQQSSRNFTNASREPDWTLAMNVTDTRRFRLRLNRSSLVTASCATGACYEVVVDDGTDTWTVAVNQSDVLVDGPSTSGRCAVREGPVTVDVTDGTVNGQPCDPLRFAAGLSDDYAIRYRNGDDANGAYRLLVNASVADDGNYTTSGGPTVAPAVYAADVRLTVQRSQLTYANRIRIARGEPDG